MRLADLSDPELGLRLKLVEEDIRQAQEALADALHVRRVLHKEARRRDRSGTPDDTMADNVLVVYRL